MDIEDTSAAVDAYFERKLLKADSELEQVAQASEEAGLVPHAVSRLQAEFLVLLIKLSGAKRVLEIGCLGGYSAIAMARALPEDSSVLTTEIDTRTAEIARMNIEASGCSDRITLEVGPAMRALERVIAEGTTFDFVFIDADKVNHANYFEAALKLSKPGTLIVADNVVRDGAVIDGDSPENSVRGVRALFDAAQRTEGLTMTALQTLGVKGYDGMALFLVG